MTDTFNVTAAYVYPAGQTAYNPGDTMKLVISGDDVQTTTSQTTETIQATLTLLAADGATGTSAPVPIQLTHQTTVATHQSVKITSVSDSGGRTWTVDPGGLFATAIA